MKMNNRSVLLLLCALLLPALVLARGGSLRVGAERTEVYLPMLAAKRVGLLVNQTSRAGGRPLVDVLLQEGVGVKKIFVPEHGFRGTADAGAHVASGKDSATGLPVISLYGNNKKPTAVQLQDIDVLVYDLQDVGVRFYTYISTLQYAMEACAENGKTLIVLDRPNPNDFVDGPVLEPKHRSFVGMQEIPVAYGMTVGEYAKMLVGEKWFAGAARLQLEVVQCEGWKHGQGYALPVAPSPNLQQTNAVLVYPSLCFFEGTVVSVGRGTDRPFEQWGHPAFKGKTKHSFTPASRAGASRPPLEGQLCYGEPATDLLAAQIAEGRSMSAKDRRLDLRYLLTAYQWFPDKNAFFNSFFEKLSGTDALRKQIIAGNTEADIRASWQPGLSRFKAIRKKYLLYE